MRNNRSLQNLNRMNENICFSLQALKGKATLFRVSKNPAIETSADFVLESVSTMTDVLKWLDYNL